MVGSSRVPRSPHGRIKELSVPMSKMDEMKKFYRIIASDERNTAVLKPSTTAASAN